MFNKLLSGLRKVFTTPTPLNTVPVPQRPAYIPSYERRSEESDEDGLVFGKRLDALELNTDRIPVVMDDFLSFAQLKSGRFFFILLFFLFGRRSRASLPSLFLSLSHIKNAFFISLSCIYLTLTQHYHTISSRNPRNLSS